MDATCNLGVTPQPSRRALVNAPENGESQLVFLNGVVIEVGAIGTPAKSFRRLAEEGTWVGP